MSYGVLYKCCNLALLTQKQQNLQKDSQSSSSFKAPSNGNENGRGIGVGIMEDYGAVNATPTTTTTTTPNNSSQSSEIASASPWQVQWQQASMKVYHNVNRGVYELMAENVADQTRLAQNQSEKRVIKFDLDHHLSLTATSCEAVFLQEKKT